MSRKGSYFARTGKMLLRRSNPLPTTWMLLSSREQRRSLLQELNRPALPAGELTAEKACLTFAALQPENAIIVDEGSHNKIFLYTSFDRITSA